ATRFHMSSRTFRRQLQGEGLSFQVLLDRVRMDSARHFLTETDLTIQQITERLGYGDPSNFIRAFRRHHGCTPGQYRANTN
ncbi:MAG TPA: helix-turn-helix domain-containing protein, partial [Aquabacterium sp.]|nr:helix-turn-helix domain-containing protein [Aquabacterium sp.]